MLGKITTQATNGSDQYSVSLEHDTLLINTKYNRLLIMQQCDIHTGMLEP